MNAARTFRMLVLATGIAAAAATVAWTHARVDGGPVRPLPNMVPVGTTPLQPSTSADAIDSLATAMSDHDPFRLTREPSAVAYAPELDGVPAPPPPPPKPPIAVSGTIGPPWVAVLEGVPAHDGSLLAKVGDTVSRAPYALLTIRAIRHDTVVVRAADTTWTLTVRRVWH